MSRGAGRGFRRITLGCLAMRVFCGIDCRTKAHHSRGERLQEAQGECDMKKLFFWASVISGAVAAYMMYKRGEPIGKIAQQALSNPVGSLAHEVKEAF